MIRKILFALFVALSFISPTIAQWDAPPSYYSNATGTGSTLKSQLESAMSTGHIQGRYGDFRFSAAIHDQDPNNPGNIILSYNLDSVDSMWDSGSTWNREHVWPQSRQPGSASNSSTGNLGDPHALRPATPSVNSSRGNNPFGFGNTTGPFGNSMGYWFPGEMCRGDIARSLFYSDTRWTSTGISLVLGEPVANEMGDLASLIEWHYLDPPDEFERRRNHTIFSETFNPLYYTNNRNAYVDRPEFVWSVYFNQENDSTITIDGGQVFTDGTSMLEVDFGDVEVGETINTTFVATLNKTGLDGTFYSIASSGNANSDIYGRYNAFPMDMTGVQQIEVTLDYDPQVVGIYTGSVVIDNLDVTTQGGMGKGANDGDDVINLTIEVTDPFLLGDVNCDGSINLLDIQPFVDLLSVGGYSEKADINQDGALNLLDVDGFVDLLAG